MSMSSRGALLGRPITITGIGAHVPANVVTNDALAATLDTSDEWIRQRTGIQERRVAEPGLSSSDLGMVAARQALADADLDPSLHRAGRDSFYLARPYDACDRCAHSARMRVRQRRSVRCVCRLQRFRLCAGHGGRFRGQWSIRPRPGGRAQRPYLAFSIGRTALPPCCSATAPARWWSRRKTPRRAVAPPASWALTWVATVPARSS